MNFIPRLRLHSPHLRIKTLITPRPTSRNYGLTAKQEEDDEEEELEMIVQRRLLADYYPSTFDPTEHRSPPTDRVFRLVDVVTSLTLIEVVELVSIIMKRLRMDTPPVIGVMKPGATTGLAGMAARGTAVAGGAKEEVKAEKMVFKVKLESFEVSAKIKIIKEVRSFTELGLKETKELVEKAPAVVKAGVSKEEGEHIVEKLKALGAKVVLE